MQSHYVWSNSFRRDRFRALQELTYCIRTVCRLCVCHISLHSANADSTLVSSTTHPDFLLVQSTSSSTSSQIQGHFSHIVRLLSTRHVVTCHLRDKCRGPQTVARDDSTARARSEAVSSNRRQPCTLLSLTARHKMGFCHRPRCLWSI
jgi:hypothetical protein